MGTETVTAYDMIRFVVSSCLKPIQTGGGGAFEALPNFKVE